MSARYAIYYVPEAESALDVLGRSLLGRNAFGEEAQRLRLNLPESLPLEEITKAPRHYGLHATLKAPFELAPGRTEGQLRDAVQDLAQQCHSLLLSPLVVDTVPNGAGGRGTFLALRPLEPCAALHALAERCVRELEAFRAPLSVEDIARRKNLTPRQQEYLCRFGYPHVLEDYHFHITLTDTLDDQVTRELVAAALRGACAQVCTPQRLELRSLALVTQPDRRSPFRLLATFPFSSSV